jgi:hypothetical protein
VLDLKQKMNDKLDTFSERIVKENAANKEDFMQQVVADLAETLFASVEPLQAAIVLQKIGSQLTNKLQKNSESQKSDITQNATSGDSN